MKTPVLCRVDQPPAAPIATERLAAGLRLHLQHAELISMVMRIGARQQGYVATSGCSGCCYNRCLPGCRMALLRRLMRSHGATLTHVPGGMAQRRYTRLVLAIPQERSQPLAGLPLVAWQEARLLMHWRRSQHGALCVAAALLVGADGPDPCELLRSYGWFARLVPVLLPWLARPHPHGLLLWAGWRADPYVLIDPPGHAPGTPTEAAPEVALDRPMSNLEAHAEMEEPFWLDYFTALLKVGAALSPPAAELPPPMLAPAPEEQDHGWPLGPGGLKRSEVELLIKAMLADESIMKARPQKSQMGASPKRIAELKVGPWSKDQRRQLAYGMLVWMERADLLGPPIQLERPWSDPRVILINDPLEIATRLAAVAPPDLDEARSLIVERSGAA